MSSITSAWSDERIEQLKKLWDAGLSCSQIAHEMGGFEHCEDGGRSAVIGKVHRLGLCGRAKSPSAKPKQHKATTTVHVPKVREARNKALGDTAPTTSSTLPKRYSETAPLNRRHPRNNPSPGFMPACERRERGYIDHDVIGRPITEYVSDPADLEAAQFLEARYARQFG